MEKGDLVRCKTLDAKQYKFGFIEDSAFEEVWDQVGVIIEYNSWEKIATVLLQSTGKKVRIAARDLEIIKRSPNNKEKLMRISNLMQFPCQVYCDMDGVLVDFEGPATQRIRESLRSPPEGLESLCSDVISVYGYDVDITEIKRQKLPRTESLKILVGKLFENDVEWWANLPFLEEGRKLWSVISKLDRAPIILTSPMDQNGCTASAQGKILWVKKNLCSLDTIRWDERIVFSHNKYEYALDGEDPTVLIDDYPRKVDPFNSHGGFGILHRGSAKETLDSLEKTYANLGHNLGENP